MLINDNFNALCKCIGDQLLPEVNVALKTSAVSRLGVWNLLHRPPRAFVLTQAHDEEEMIEDVSDRVKMGELIGRVKIVQCDSSHFRARYYGHRVDLHLWPIEPKCEMLSIEVEYQDPLPFEIGDRRDIARRRLRVAVALAAMIAKRAGAHELYATFEGYDWNASHVVWRAGFE
jgi:hypothetical protein